MIKQLPREPIAILGYGQEGEAVARYLIRHRLEPVLFDQRPWEEWPAKKQTEIKSLGVNFIFGPDAFLELAGFDLAFRSPGVPLSHPGLTRWPKLKITSQTKWFFEHCPCRVIGVTGTKGKGTTSALIHAMLQAEVSGQKALSYLTGNIGKTQPLDFIDNLKPDDWVVYELSSFQLQDLHKSPHIAVVLMVTSEHLDYHKNNQEYLDAKSAITRFQAANDLAVINGAYPASVQIGEQGQGKKIYFSGKEIPDFIDKAKIQLRGQHNLENIAASVRVAEALSIDPETINRAVLGFKGLEHRLEFVNEKQGVKFYNDSFSTTPETAIAGIRAFNEPLILIAGGSSKNSDFGELGKVIANSANLKTLILIGAEAGRIKSAVGKTPIPILEDAQNMQEIFEQIKTVASEGDVVLLSPACASFRMFKNYNDRGEQFKQLAMAWTL